MDGIAETGRGFAAGLAGYGLETKDVAFEQVATVADDGRIEGYASLFGSPDQSGDVVERGAFAKSLDRLRAAGRAVKLLWQHDPAEPMGVWDMVREDDRGLKVRGRLLTETRRGREALALLRAGAIDGLSIGYRAIRSVRGDHGGRILTEIDLWEVSLVTFPMLPEARAAACRPGDEAEDAQEDLGRVLADALSEARGRLRG
ncbi:HK97 family phage prohead protease [Rhodovulum sp. DZ06]|uniref:HK97 family phage prohead protease n=1 Tax=Rhodovulum sp. DZ06 TaxID=3425126 RepID=UPI003D351454